MRTLLTASMLLLMAACIPTLTLQPVWDKEHEVSLPALEGRWISEDGDSLLRVRTKDKDSDKKYLLDYVSEDGVTHYEGHLVRLGDSLILDLCLEEEAGEKLVAGQAFAPILPAHFFARIRLDGDKLHLGVLDDEKMEKQIASGVVKVQSAKTSDTLVLTGTTAELQEAVSQLAKNNEIWEDAVFYRASVLSEKSAGK